MPTLSVPVMSSWFSLATFDAQDKGRGNVGNALNWRSILNSVPCTRLKLIDRLPISYFLKLLLLSLHSACLLRLIAAL
jgi:hypothetical protein